MRHRFIAAGILYFSTTLVGMTSEPVAKAQAASQKAKQISETETLLAAGKLAEAEKTARSLVAQNPQLSTAYILLGRVYDAEQEFDKAKESYFQSIQLNSDDATPYVRVGADYLAQNIPRKHWLGSPAPWSSTLRTRRAFSCLPPL